MTEPKMSDAPVYDVFPKTMKGAAAGIPHLMVLIPGMRERLEKRAVKIASLNAALKADLKELAEKEQHLADLQAVLAGPTAVAGAEAHTEEEG